MKQLWKQLGKVICYVLFYFGMQMIVTMGAMFFVTIFYAINHIELFLQNDFMAMNAVLVTLSDQVMAAANEITMISGVLSIGLLALFFMIRRKSVIKEFNIKKVNMFGYAGSALMGFSMTFAVMLLVSLLPADWLAGYEESAALLEDASFVVMFLANVIVAPIAEEILFRGLVFTRLRKAMPTWVAIFITSLSFAVLHGQIVWILYAFVLGMVLTCLAAKYDSIIPGIVMHMVFNFFGSFMSYWALPEFVMGLIVVVGLLLLVPSVLLAFIPKTSKDVIYSDKDVSLP